MIFCWPSGLVTNSISFTLLSKGPGDLKQNGGTQEQKLLSRAVLHALLHGVIGFVQAWRVEMNLFTKNIRGFVDFGKQAEPKNPCLFAIYFDQGRRSCSGASCIYIFLMICVEASGLSLLVSFQPNVNQT